MKKTYTMPSLEITRFATEDVLTSSDGGTLVGGGGTIHPGQPGTQLPGKAPEETPANPT